MAVKKVMITKWPYLTCPFCGNLKIFEKKIAINGDVFEICQCKSSHIMSINDNLGYSDKWIKSFPDSIDITSFTCTEGCNCES